MNKPEIKDHERVADDDELLVAYLDGELPREQRDDVENRLIAEESLRWRLQALQRSWDLLDWLPQTHVDERSVQTTLQLVVKDLNDHYQAPMTDVGKTRLKPRRSSMPWLWWGLPLMIAALAFVGVRVMQKRSQTQQVADFPLAMDMDAYLLGNNRQLIDDLLASSRWSGVVGESMTAELERLIDPESPESLYVTAEGQSRTPTASELAERLQELSSEQRMTALARWERFNRLDESAKNTIRNTAAMVRDSENGAEVLDTIRRYVRMREQLSDETVAQIESESGEQRQLAIESAVDEIINSIGRVTGRNLSEDAIERIDFTVIQIVKARLKAVSEPGGVSAIERIEEWIKQRGRRSNDPDTAYRIFALTTLLRDPNWNSGASGGKPGDSGRGFRLGAPLEKVAPLTQRETDMIVGMLPASDLDALQQYEHDPWMRAMIVRDYWAVEAVRRKMWGVAKPLSLAERYEALPDQRREVLDLMSPEEARKTLIDGM